MKHNNNYLLILPLLILLIFLSTGALYGGLMLIIDPTGGKLQLPYSFLEGTTFNSYRVPGLILFFIFGVFSALVIAGLIIRPSIRWAGILNIYKTMHWSWTYSLYIGICLIFWINAQQIIINTSFILQQVLSLTGLFIIIWCMVPAVIRYYETDTTG